MISDKSQVNGNAVAPKQPKWRNAVSNFGAVWFTVTMDTGILGVLMHQLPYQFKGIGILSVIMFVFALVQFIVFSIITILRWTLFYKPVLRRTASSMDEICYLAAPPIAFLTLTALTALIVSNAHWGGHAFTIVAYVMWWIAVAWMVLTCFLVSVAVFTLNVADERSISTAMFLPIVGLATAAVIGGLICNYAYDISPGLAVPVIIVSLLIDGIGIWVGLFVYSAYFQRLIAVGWPTGLKRVLLMLLIGPAGQTGAALLLLGSAATASFGGYDKGTFLTSEAASSMSSACVVLALLLLGLDCFWIFCAIWGVVAGCIKREIGYGLPWWGTIFPLATTTTTFISLSDALDSPTFRVLATGLLLILVVDYLINLVLTIWYSVKGDLLIKPEGPEEKSA